MQQVPKISNNKQKRRYVERVVLTSQKHRKCPELSKGNGHLPSDIILWKGRVADDQKVDAKWIVN